MQRAKGFKAIGHTGPPAEIGEAGAASHCHMLAEVHPLAGLWVAKRSGPSAECLAAFEQIDAASALGRRHGRCHAGQSAADDGNGRFAR